MRDKGGRPTKYRVSMCDRVVDLMREGASKVEVCADLDICYETFQRWQEEHAQFSESVKKGEMLSQAWWERLGRQGASSAVEINPTTWIFNMKNRFGWMDKQDIKQQVTDTTPRIELVLNAPRATPKTDSSIPESSD